MEAEISSANHPPGILHRLLPAAIPVLLISIGYVDPGKWAATVEGGARFGSDLVALMFVFNFAAILCQYLSACIGVVTGRDLAQVKDACGDASKAEELAKARLSQMNYDLNVHCRIRCLQRPRVRFSNNVQEKVIPKADLPRKSPKE